MTKKKFVWSFLAITLLIGLGASGVRAQYYNFGQNRIQYDNFHWRYLQSEHFDVYYYQDKNYYLAVFAAQSLESALKEIQQDFDYQITSRIKVVIYDSHADFTQTNVVPLPVNAEGIGGVTEPYKNRITLPFMGDYGEFRHTIHHELVHAVINEMFYGGSVQSIIQNNIQLQIPNWFNEGMAEWSSLHYDTNEDNFVRDATINNYMPPISQLYGYFWYRGGQSVWEYIVETYGREKIGEIFHDIKDTRSVDQGFKEAIGLSVKELSERWHDYLKKRYWPEIAERQSLTDVATQVTKREFSGSYNTSPALSPQGDKLAMISNVHGYFDIIVVDPLTGKRLKTLVHGENNVNFESLNILNPNLSWSPDGRKLAFSYTSEGKKGLAIVDYNTDKIQRFQFPGLDAIYSVAWSPDGKKIAFNGTASPNPDIFVYNLETGKFTNVTDDIFTDKEPAWGPDSKTIYFVSDRGDHTKLNTYELEYDEITNPNLNQTDIYSVKIGDQNAVRLTNTPGWSESDPQVTRDGRLVYISDQNGIPNAYEMNMKTRTSKPLTNLISGILQMSLSADGSRLAIDTYNGGYVDIFLIRDPFSKAINHPLKPNLWAKQRASTPITQWVPAIGYAREMFGNKQNKNNLAAAPLPATVDTSMQGNQPVFGSGITMSSDTTKSDTVKTVAKAQEAKKDTTSATGYIDYRNYTFGSAFDTVASLKGTKDVFKPENNKTKSGKLVPHRYRVTLSPELTYFQGSLGTSYYSTYGLFQVLFTDVLGDYQVGLASSLQFDLSNSSYVISYANLKHRTNYSLAYYHYAMQYYTYGYGYSGFYSGLIRYRTYGGQLNFQYPINQFTRIDYGASVIGIARDFGALGLPDQSNQHTTLLYPNITFTQDYSKPGYITPEGGYRYAISLTASPTVSKGMPQFESISGDFRKYFGLGDGYVFATRFSGGMSFGKNAQTYFLGGMDGWINYQWANNGISLNSLADIFLTQPALPMRGYPYDAMYGDKFGLINLEFRFPLFAAILPGPIPILPLYNMTGEVFTDIGASWGIDNPNTTNINEAKFDFRIAQPVTNTDQQGTPWQTYKGSILVGAGFGIRTILLGIPVRWDIAWPYSNSSHGPHFVGHPINYITIGIDF